MPRIAVVSPLFPTPQDPSRGLPIYQTVRYLQSWVDLEVYCPMAVYPRWRCLHPLSYRYHRTDLTCSLPDVRTHYFEYPAFPVLSRPFNGLLSGRRLLSLLKDARPDLILAYWIYPEGYGAVWTAKKLGVPVVIGSRGSDLRRIRDPLTLYFVRKTLRQASFVLTVSEELRQRAAHLGASPHHTRAVLNGCDTSVFHLTSRLQARTTLGLEPASEIVLYVGRLTVNKGLGELVRAFIQLAPRRPRLQLICIGEGSLRQQLQGRLLQASLAHRVRFTGYCSPSQVARWVAAADLVCLPSHSEGCPNVVIEALSSGRPVVASNVGGIPELVDSDCAILFPPGDYRRLVVALDQALSHQWDETAISQKFHRGWQQVAEETYQICRALLPPNGLTVPKPI